MSPLLDSFVAMTIWFLPDFGFEKPDRVTVLNLYRHLLFPDLAQTKLKND